MKVEHYSLVCDIGELSALFHEALDLSTFLQRTATMVAVHVDAEVCSIYLYDPSDRELTLSATHGLNRELVGKVRLKLGDGLTGVALKQLRYIAEPVASASPFYRHVPHLKEEEFECFLAVPLLRGITRVGVLVVQRRKNRQFTRMDVQGLRAVGAQLTGAIENARLLLGAAPTPSEGDDSPLESVATFEGQVASGGLARGPSLRLDREGQYDSLAAADYPPDLVLDDFRAAISATEEQLEEMQAQVGERLSDVASLIFSSHLLILKDPGFTDAVERLIEEGVAVPQAVLRISDEYIHRFQSSNVDFVREKANDVKDLVTRLLHNISDAEAEATEWRGRIVIAREFFPSQLLRLSSQQAAGVVLVTGGVTSHVAILARSLVVPLVIVDDPRLLVLAPGTDLLLDADHGRVYVRPSEAVAAHFGARLAAQQAPEPRGTIEPQTATADGTLVRLMANVNLMSDADLARQLGAEGIGLYRTEFPFMVRRELPTEEEQYTLYRDLVARFPNGDILFRTLDIGGDKVLPYFPDMREQNPFLGVRSIRFSLRNLDIFTQQLRAMLRANRGRKLQVMFPMVTSIEELRAGRAAVEQCAAELREEDHQISTEVAVGAMVEVPSVVPLIDDFAREADFLSIGTNDLIQYLLAVDRTNEKVAHLYLPHHPAVLRTLHAVVTACTRRGVGVSVCGDMAHQAQYLPFLIGIGVRSLSVEPIYLPAVQAAISGIELAAAQALAERMVAATTVDEVTELLPVEELDTENLVWV